ncbi:hypothetical protein NUW58_g5227 [Xylaria curta]|uniref:Uncharacterized protein n=1 Tax=Xylaria curta TaxID=42375 RepID=A0ACC1P558_9PEZI|nr:hypothetical protein NUW58_g5227 [Xylaria curta]
MPEHNALTVSVPYSHAKKAAIWLIAALGAKQKQKMQRLEALTIVAFAPSDPSFTGTAFDANENQDLAPQSLAPALRRKRELLACPRAVEFVHA